MQNKGTYKNGWAQEIVTPKGTFAKLQLVLQEYISLQEKRKKTNKDGLQKLALDIAKDLPSFGITEFYKLPAMEKILKAGTSSGKRPLQAGRYQKQTKAIPILREKK